MRRSELEHVLRAAGAISDVREWIIVGSQAILGSVPDAPAELVVSQEVDLYTPQSEYASDLIDGSIGERSPFHETFGYYAHGIGPETAVLPTRWRSRASIVESANTGGVRGICPHPSDLAVSKLVAWREKDRDFVQALIRHRITSVPEIEERLEEMDNATADRVRPRLRQLL